MTKGAVQICGLMSVALLSTGSLRMAAQESMAPWTGGLPGIEHPAAWALVETPLACGVQHANRWTGGSGAMNDQWLGIGWTPQPKGGGWGNNISNWSFGLSNRIQAAGQGWNEMRHALHAAIKVPLAQDWKGSAGIGIGVRGWVLDGRQWSWDQQYGSGGYNPAAPTGEPDGLVAGAGLSPEVAVGFAWQHQQRSGQGPRFQGAVSLHHVLPITSAHFMTTHADTVRRTLSGWVETLGQLGNGALDGRAWLRGAWQGQSHLIEVGTGIGKSWGTTSRYTRNTLGHHFELGIIWRTDGVLRAPLTWQHGELTTWLAPGLQVGHPSPAAQGWAVGMTWNPDFTGATPMGSR